MVGEPFQGVEALRRRVRAAAAWGGLNGPVIGPGPGGLPATTYAIGSLSLTATSIGTTQRHGLIPTVPMPPSLH